MTSEEEKIRGAKLNDLRAVNRGGEQPGAILYVVYPREQRVADTIYTHTAPIFGAYAVYGGQLLYTANS